MIFCFTQSVNKNINGYGGQQLNLLFFNTCLFQLWIHFNLWKGWKPSCCRECSESHNQTSSRILPNTSTACRGTSLIFVFKFYTYCTSLSSSLFQAFRCWGVSWIIRRENQGKNDYIWLPVTAGYNYLKWLWTWNTMNNLIVQSNHLIGGNLWII